MSDRLDILCAGRIYADLVFTGEDLALMPGREVFAEGLGLVAGGGAVITACHAAAHGLRAGVTGIAPAAPFDAVVRRDLAANRVLDRIAPAAPGSDPQVTVVLVQGSERSFLTRRPGPALPTPLRLPAARHLHIGELATALAHPELIPQARGQGMSVSLDCGWDDAAFGAPGVAGIIAAVDVFLPNRAEAERLAALGVDVAPRHLTVVKEGAAGARAEGPDGTARAAARPARVVDTTGAGDAFNAGFLSGWLDGCPLEESLARGNAAGSRAVERIGGAGALPPVTPDRPVTRVGQV